MIHSFSQVEGVYIERVEGQERLAYSLSDRDDFYDMLEWQEQGGYQGATLTFYDLQTGTVDRPFPKMKNVMYGTPVYLEDAVFFLQGNFDIGKVTLFRYTQETGARPVTELNIEEIDLLNLKIIGEQVHIISQDRKVHCYYPETFSFDLAGNETVELISDGKVYIEAWIEEGWDTEKDAPTENYKFYHNLILKDFEGNTLSEEKGQLYHSADGSWWIS